VRRGCVVGAAFLLTATRTASAATFFDEKPNAFGVEPGPSGQAGGWTNYVALADLDGDGSLDVVMPNADGWFTKGPSAEPLLVYLNDGAGNLRDASTAMVGGLSGWIRQVAIGDVDGDGKLDLYVPDAWGAPDHLFLGTSGPSMKDDTAARLPAGLASHAGAARFGDVDGDGDLDLLVGDAWTTSALPIAHLYLNDGGGRFTESTDALPTNKAGSEPVDFDLGDVDGDFDLDVLVNMHQGTNSLWINDGYGVFTDAPFPAPGAGSRFHYGPVMCDVDGDGDLDVAIDNTGGNYLEQLLVNDGTGAFTDETSARMKGNVPGADDNTMACVDVDGDGDFDLAIASLSDNERVLFNDGTGHFAGRTDPSFSVVTDSTLWFDFGDLDGDGKLDAVTAQGETDWLDRVYRGTPAAPADSRAPVFRAVSTVTGATSADRPSVRFAVVDSAVTDTGPRVKRAFVRVTTPAGTAEVAARFVGGDLFQATLDANPPGSDVTYAACATDRLGNTGCASPVGYHVADASPGAPPPSSSHGCGATGRGPGELAALAGLLAAVLRRARAARSRDRPTTCRCSAGTARPRGRGEPGGPAGSCSSRGG
jgi:hypothetical protein